jgi:AAA family ATPase
MATIFTLRPMERTVNHLDQSAFRVQLGIKELKNLGLTAGDLVKIHSSKGFHGYAIAWLAQQTNPGNKPIAKISDVLREKYEMNLTDGVSFEKANEPSTPLQAITIRFSQDCEVLKKCNSAEELQFCVAKSLCRLLPCCRCRSTNCYQMT